jgi:hypothetical protein
MRTEEASEGKLGTFANAFRVMVDPDGVDCFLDFLVYSTFEKQACVKERVRVPVDFLPALYNALDRGVRHWEADLSRDEHSETSSSEGGRRKTNGGL